MTIYDWNKHALSSCRYVSSRLLTTRCCCWWNSPLSSFHSELNLESRQMQRIFRFLWPRIVASILNTGVHSGWWLQRLKRRLASNLWQSIPCIGFKLVCLLSCFFYWCCFFRVFCSHYFIIALWYSRSEFNLQEIAPKYGAISKCKAWRVCCEAMVRHMDM